METLECKVLDVKEWAGAPDPHGNKKYTVIYEGGEGVYTTKNNTFFVVGSVCKFTSEKSTWSNGKEYFKLRSGEWTFGEVIRFIDIFDIVTIFR